MGDIKLDVNHSMTEEDFREVMERGREAITLALSYTAQEVWGGIRKNAPVDRGRLAGSFQMEQVDDLSFRIFSGVEYAMMVHEGTGIHGPTGQEIRPVSAQALKFFWSKINQTVVMKGDLETPGEKASFARWAEERGMTPIFAWPKGIEGRPYATEAIQETSGRTQEFVRRAMRETMPT